MNTFIRFFILAIALTAVFSQDQGKFDDARVYRKFQKFIEDYGKNYTSIDEMNIKFQTFKKNYITAVGLRDPNSTDKSLGVTEHMDLTEEEFKGQFFALDVSDESMKEAEEKGLYGTNNTYMNNNDEDMETLNEEAAPVEGRNLEGFLSENTPLRNLQSGIPSNFDWRSRGAVSGVKHQGSCGGCWAFSVLVNVEAMYYLKYRRLLSFSPQQLIDCDYTNSGCGGGSLQNAFNYLQRNPVQLMSSYPFRGFRQNCRSRQGVARVKSWFSAGTRDENYIAQMLYRNGPLAVTMNATPLQFYRGGIFNPGFCSNAVNHGVALVGYGISGGMRYWIVKNSWGSSWGEGGFFRMARGRGLCGINKYALGSVIY